MTREIICRIIPGRTYRYTKDLPKACKDALYRVHRTVMDFPSRQEKILVEGLTGVEEGFWFTCTPQAFANCYALVEDEKTSDDPLITTAKKEYDLTSTGSGH